MVLLDLGFRFGTVRGEVWTPGSHGDSLSLRFANCNPNEPLTLNSAVGWRESPFEAMKPGLC